MNRPRRLTFREACQALRIFEESDTESASSDENVDGTGDATINDSLTDQDLQESPEADIIAMEESDARVEGSDAESEEDDDIVTLTEEANINSDFSLRNPANIPFSYAPFSPALRQRNIMRQAPGPRSNPVDEISSWRLFLTNEILSIIKRCTNRKISQFNRTNGRSIKLFSEDEIHAALAIIYRAGVDRDNFSDLLRLFHPTDSRPFYRAAMGINRFKQFIRFIRFDDFRSRAERQKSDRLAAFSDVWELFVSELKKHYIPDSDITIDEQLVGYRGRAPGRTYMPSKPRKYGVKIFWAADSNTGYALNGKIYLGRAPNQQGPERELGKNIVLELMKPFYNTGRNVVMDNFFTSFSLAAELIPKNLTILGTMRKNRREIPRCLLETRSMEQFESR